MAHAIRMHATGGPEVLVYEEVEIGDPGPGEARIRQTAIGLNYIDTYHRSGLYPLPMPTSIGSEAAGVVESVGAGVTWIRRGDRVAYSGGPPGAYATERVVSAERLHQDPFHRRGGERLRELPRARLHDDRPGLLIDRNPIARVRIPADQQRSCMRNDRKELSPLQCFKRTMTTDE